MKVKRKKYLMKTIHTLSLLFISLLCLAGFTACDNSDDMIWDFTPIVLYISVQDTQGNDLLNPEIPGNIAKQGIKAIYKEKTYIKDAPIPQTKAYMAILTGLQTKKNKEGKYFLAFGEFNGDQTFENEKVVINWNDGTQDVITFSSKLTWKSRNKPVFNRKFSLNGKDNGLDTGGFTIIKKPALITSIASDRFPVTDIRYGINARNKQEIYEGMTDYYQRKYPDSEVKEAVRLQMSKHSPV